MSAEQYTPTTEEVMRSYSLPSAVTNPKRADETFSEYLSRISIEGHQDQMRSEEAARRWLAAHDARVRAEALAEVTDELVEVAAEAIWNLNPMPSWRTWSERVHLEKVEHRGDKSWSGPVDRCRNHARTALEAASAAVTNQQDRSTK